MTIVWYIGRSNCVSPSENHEITVCLSFPRASEGIMPSPDHVAIIAAVACWFRFSTTGGHLRDEPYHLGSIVQVYFGTGA